MKNIWPWNLGEELPIEPRFFLDSGQTAVLSTPVDASSETRKQKPLFLEKTVTPKPLRAKCGNIT